MTETRTDPKAFVDGLVDEMKQLFDRLEEGETLEAESGGDVAMVTLLKLALESELEAAELAGSWIASTPEPDVKSMFARQAADEMKHYEMIRDRLLELGESEESLRPSPTRSALYQYLQTLRTTPERIAAGPFAREAVAEVRNQQFIDFCEESGDAETLRLYTEVIQPEEIEHNRLGRELLERYAVTPSEQSAAATAMRASLAIAEELSSLTEATTGLSPIPVS